jgi:hypothetical protein
MASDDKSRPSFAHHIEGNKDFAYRQLDMPAHVTLSNQGRIVRVHS